MLRKLVDVVLKNRFGDSGDARQQGVRWTVTGMATLLSGQKMAALGMFGRGVRLLERHWRDEHPEIEPGLKNRIAAALAFYESTHQNKTNRTLHVIGIPMVVGGAVGLLASPAFTPMWWGAAGLFVVGWQVNIAGHVFFEKNKPAFAEDPLAFVVGPLWDVKQMLGSVIARRGAPSADALAT